MLETSGVSEKLKTKDLIVGDAEITNTNQLLQATASKIGHLWQSFYDLVDALNECELLTANGQSLERELGLCECCV